MTSGKAESGMEPRKPGGSTPREAAGDKAPWTPGSTRNQRQGKEFSAECEAINALVKGKRITWNKSGRKSAKREADLCTMLESAATDEKKERDMDKLGDKLERSIFLKGKKRKVRQRVSWKRCGKNVEAAQHKSFEAEQSLCSALREYVDTFGRDRGRPKTIITKLWQSMQSRETENSNFDKDLEDILSKMKKMGESEEDKAARLWKQFESDDQ